MTGYTDEQIARVVHEANRVMQDIDGDEAPSLPWHAETDHIRGSAVAGVRAARGGATPEQLHETWCEDKLAAGWRYGEIKDADAKTHPCLVPYAELPEHQQAKDRLFLAIVGALAR